MMKRLTYLIALFSLAMVTGAFAQPDDDDEGKEFDDFNFDEIPVDDYRDLDYIGVGGGYLGMYALINYDELNSIANRFGLGEFSGGMLMHGGGGFFGGIGIRNLRYGVYGVGGSKEVSQDGIDIDGTNVTRTMRFHNSLVAASLDYAIFMPPDGLYLFPGVLVGRGASEIEIHQGPSNGSTYQALFDTTQLRNGAGTDNGNEYIRASRTGLHLQPMLNVEYALNDHVLLRAGAGYAINLGDKWNDPGGNEITDMPDVNSNGLSVHFGLFLGLFQN